MEGDWSTKRQDILQQLLELQAPLDEHEQKQCFGCNEAMAVFRCADCMGSYLCSACDKLIHKLNPLHDREVFRHGFYDHLSQGMYYPSTEGKSEESVKLFPGKY